MSALRVYRCERCGHSVYPRRALCPRCHAADWMIEDAGPGTVEESTVVEHAVGAAAGSGIVSVRLDRGPVVIAAVEGASRAGEKVLLEDAGAGVRARPADVEPS